ncbi:MAG: CPBP family intramembrane metalloprotease [Leptospiraceae bacterium]|nr:CPBP family intramembrane metalloprotease [Leptospiraceae bacterium]MCP5493327.1 CPBP family intramembrane metalloprotease [Leptospiraceae bacterium]
MENNQEPQPKKSDILSIFLSQILVILVIFIIHSFFSMFNAYNVIIFQKLPQEIFETTDSNRRTEILEESYKEIQSSIEKDPGIFTTEYLDIIINQPLFLLWDRVIWALCFLLPAYFFLVKVMKTKCTTMEEELGFQQLRLGLSVGIVIFLLVTSGSLFLELIGQKPVLNKFNVVLFTKIEGNFPLLVWSIFTVGIVTGMIEELFFRGYLLNHFMDKGFEKEGLVFTSVIFGAMHYTPDSSVIIPIVLTIVGYIFGLYYVKTKNIWISISAHASYNSLGLILAYFIGDKAL